MASEKAAVAKTLKEKCSHLDDKIKKLKHLKIADSNLTNEVLVFLFWDSIDSIKLLE